MNFDKTPQYYTVQNVAEIEDFDKDDYGNTWFNVKFEGNAETFMWLAKNTPEVGKKYYGHLEPTKSGKRLRFKTDKVPEGYTGSSKASECKDTQDSILRSVALKAAVDYYQGNTKANLDLVLDGADKFLTWLKDEKPKEAEKEQPDEQWTSDIPAEFN